MGAVLLENLCALFLCQLGLWRETEEGHLRLCILLRLLGTLVLWLWLLGAWRPSVGGGLRWM